MSNDSVVLSSNEKVSGPPFTPERYPEVQQRVMAERDYLRVLLKEANEGHFNTLRIRTYLGEWLHD